MQRPWSQKQDPVKEDKLAVYEPSCYLCPSNTRKSGAINPKYDKTFFFKNDFASLNNNVSETLKSNNELFSETSERGVCEVICYTPQHDTNFSKLTISEIEEIIKIWKERYIALSSLDYINHVQIFETRGKEVGNSTIHPHCQIWAQESIPSLPAKIIRNQEEYFKKHKQKMLLEYIKKEVKDKERIICSIGNFTLLVPFWAEWPYETYIMPTIDLSSMAELSEKDISDLSKMLFVTAKMYSLFFERPLNGAPYMMSISQKPTLEYENDSMQLFFKYITPLLTPTRQKYQAGYEKSAESQRDLTPELAAKQLREVVEENKDRFVGINVHVKEETAQSNSRSFFDYSSSEKIKLMRAAGREAQKEQNLLLKAYEAKFG